MKNNRPEVVKDCHRARCSEQFDSANSGIHVSEGPSALTPKGASKNAAKKWAMGCTDVNSNDPKGSHILPPLPHEKVKGSRKSSTSSYSSSVRDSNTCIPSKRTVFDCILKEYNGSVAFDVISKRKALFPDGCDDITTWFRARKDSFLLSESKDGSIANVSVFCRRAKLCFIHASSKKCLKKECEYLHVCKGYIAGYCRQGDKCKMKHDFQYDETRKFISKLDLDGLTNEQLRKVIQFSLPKVCLEYNAGKCATDWSCSQIHICEDFIKTNCIKVNCALKHKTALLTQHTNSILRRYGVEIKDGNLTSVINMLLVCDYSTSRPTESRKNANSSTAEPTEPEKTGTHVLMSSYNGPYKIEFFFVSFLL